MSNFDMAAEKPVFLKYFEEISRIPHGSGNCSGIADYLCDFAKNHGLEYHRDEADNVLIKKAGVLGLEDRPAVILQGHIDMVAEKTPESKKDLSVDPIELVYDGDYIRALDTTLGGDDGIAVAYALTILASNDIPHPPIEALFTSDEEIGLIGADKFDASLLSGKTLINIDSEEEGVFTVGCAGGVRIDMPLLGAEPTASADSAYRLKVSGLLGGHSGVEIDKGRANAAKLIAEMLLALQDVKLISINGGNMDNAIMRECEATFVNDCDFEFLSRYISLKAQDIRERFLTRESDISFTLFPIEGDFVCYSRKDTKRIISMLDALPSAVVKMSEDIEGFPESSANVGVVRLDASSDDSFVTVSLRSGRSEGKEGLIDRLSELCQLFGFGLTQRGDYPAWEYKKDSPLRDEARLVYREKYGKEPVILTIHAGLECGIFADKIEDLDCISIGPDMSGIHTTEEKLSISSSVRVFDFILELIKRL